MTKRACAGTLGAFVAATLAASLAGACGNSGTQSFSAVDSGIGAEAATAADAAADSGVSKDAAADGDTGTGSLIGDGATADGAACQHLNIGILGKPGANASSNFQSWLVSAGTTVQRIQDTAPAPTLDAATLQPFDVIILDWLTRDYTAAEASVVAAFISAGGGLVSMTGYDNVTTDDWHANSLITSLGVAYSGTLLNGPVTSFAPHPITAGLTSVTFDGGYAITDLGTAGATRTPIAFLPSPGGGGNVTVGVAVQEGSGRAFVWGDEWIEFDSEWSTLPEIKQLWVQVFSWIAPSNRCAITPPQ